MNNLLVEQSCGQYAPASASEILRAAQEVIDQLHPAGQEFNDPKEVKRYLSVKLAGHEHEVFAVLFMDVQNRLIEFAEMFSGSLMQTAVYPREVAKKALQLNAASVILSHNHPNGSAQPSESDKQITRHLKDALELVDVRVLDHIIIAGNESFSFSEGYLL